MLNRDGQNQMCRLLVGMFFFVSVLVSYEGFAQAARPKQPGVSEAIPGSPRASSDIFLSAGTGLAIFHGNTGWALKFGFLKEVSDGSPLFFGADVGLNFWSFNPVTPTAGTYATGATGIALLPTIIYRVQMARSSTIFPYLGLSIGGNIYIEKQNTITAGTTSSSTNSKLYFEALFRPGFFTRLSQNIGLEVEAGLGLLRSDFIFLPQASAVFAL